MITFESKGSFKNIDKFLKSASNLNYNNILEKYAQEGVKALTLSTPKSSGKTANSWGYKIDVKKNKVAVIWTNSNIENGVPIAIIIQYGHGTKNGGYVQGIDYINPSLKPIFDKMADNAWREVTKL